MKAAVKEELNHLERTSVLEKIDHSEWAATIVAVTQTVMCICAAITR